MNPVSSPATLRPSTAAPFWLSALLRPIQAFRLAYLPLVMVYFAYGALGLIDVTRDLWIKEQLTLTPAELAGIGVWLGLPWTIKMVFGELVDSVPHLRLATHRLCADRRDLHGERHGDARRRRRRLARLRPPRSVCTFSAPC